MKILTTIIFTTISFLHPALTRAQEKVFDLHVHLWNGEESVDTYLSQIDSTKQLVTGFGGIHMAVRDKPLITKEKNNELIALSRKYPALIPICSVHPMDGRTALEELERLARSGVRIIKLHPHTQKFDIADINVLNVCRKAGELGVKVLMDNANIVPGDSQDLFNLAVRCPDTTFIFAHMGGLDFRFWNIIVFAKTAKGFYRNNIYFDISATITLVTGSPLEEEFLWTMENVGIDHILLGSDFPQFTLEQALDALDQLNLDEIEKNKIRYENAARLFLE